MKLTNAAKAKIAELNAKYVGKKYMNVYYDFRAKKDKLVVYKKTITMIKPIENENEFDHGRYLAIFTAETRGPDQYRCLGFRGRDKWLDAAEKLEKELAMWEGAAFDEPVYRHYDDRDAGEVEEVEFRDKIITDDEEAVKEKIMAVAKKVAAKKIAELKKEMARYEI